MPSYDEVHDYVAEKQGMVIVMNKKQEFIFMKLYKKMPTVSEIAILMPELSRKFYSGEEIVIINLNYMGDGGVDDVVHFLTERPSFMN